MKEKIFAQLKLACGNTTSISDKTLEKIAEVLSGTITEESQIESAIEAQKPILQAIDGNINFVAANAVKKVAPEKEEKKPVKVDPIEGEPAWFSSFREKTAKETTELREKIEGYEKQKKIELASAKLRSELKAKGVNEHWLIGRNLDVESEDAIPGLVEQIATDYNTFNQKMVEEGMFSVAPKQGSGIVKEGEALGKRFAEKRNGSATDAVKGKEI